MRQYIVETQDGFWNETESTPFKEAFHRCPRVSGSMIEIDGFKYVVDPSMMRRETYTPKWIKAVVLILFFSAAGAASFNQIFVGAFLGLMALTASFFARFLKSEMQIQLWLENNPDPVPLFRGHPLPNGITGETIARYSKAKHIEKFLSPQEINWYAIIAVISVLGLVGAIIALYYQGS